jgi:hypothetical protein
MAAPETVRVKLSSEAAGAISLTPVVVRDMPLRELLEEIAAVRGRHAELIADTLKRGSVTGGGTRFRWESLDLPGADLAEAMAALPDDEPGRAFDHARCTQVFFTGPGVRVALPREVGDARKLFARTSFWRELPRLAGEIRYSGYSFRERGDVFRATLALERREAIRDAVTALRHASLARRIQLAAFEELEFVVAR